MVTTRRMKGLELPHRLGVRMTGNSVLDDLMAAVDQNFREVLNRIERQQELNVPWVSVADFGATGLESRAADQAFNNALAESANVFVPPGIHVLDQIQLRSGSSLWGTYGSVIKQRANAHAVVASGTATSGSASTLVKTSAGWVVGAFKGFTVRITAGTGSGQRRLIASNTADTVVPDPLEPFSPAPNNTSVFQILEPKHLIVLSELDDEFTSVSDLVLDGNKANQLAHNDAVRYLNTGGGPTFTDEHHLLANLIIKDFSGSGVVKSRDCREMRVFNVRVENCDEYGFDNFIEQVSASGGSDTKYLICTAAHNGKSGFRCNAGIDEYTSCKAFGNGDRLFPTDGHGFLITLGDNVLANCVAQENRYGGFYIRDTYNVAMASCIADANGGMGLVLDNCYECNIQINVGSTSGLAFQTTSAINIVNGADRNHVDLICPESEMSSGVALAAAAQRNGDNDLHINRRNYNRYFSYGRVKGTDADEHFTAGKRGAPAASNPIFVWKTTADNPPRYILEAFDGTTTKELFAVDFGNDAVQIVGTAKIKKVLTGTQSLDFGSIAAGATAELTIGVTGALAGDEATATPNGAPEAGLVWSAYAGTDIVTLRMHNTTAGAIDPAARTWRGTVTRF